MSWSSLLFMCTSTPSDSYCGNGVVVVMIVNGSSGSGRVSFESCVLEVVLHEVAVVLAVVVAVVEEAVVVVVEV